MGSSQGDGALFALRVIAVSDEPPIYPANDKRFVAFRSDEMDQPRLTKPKEGKRPDLMKNALNTVSIPTRRSNDAKEFDNTLRRKIVGQNAALEKVVEIYQMFLAGLNPRDVRLAIFCFWTDRLR